MLTGSPTRRGLRRWLTPRRATPAPVLRPSGWQPPAPAGAAVGLAVVEALDPEGRALVRMDGCPQLLRAEWALPFRYRPTRGDQVRIARQDDRAWVLAVVEGRGRAQLVFAAGLRLRAETLRLSSQVSVKLRAPRLRLRAETLELIVETLHEKLGVATRRVGQLVLRAQQVRRVIDGDDWTQARARTVKAQEAVVMDAEQLKVG